MQCSCIWDSSYQNLRAKKKKKTKSSASSSPWAPRGLVQLCFTRDFNKDLFDSTVLCLTMKWPQAVSKPQGAQNTLVPDTHTSMCCQLITQTPALRFAHSCQPSSEFIWGKDMQYYATGYRFSNLGPLPASCSKEEDLLLCSWAWQLFICQRGWLN